MKRPLGQFQIGVPAPCKSEQRREDKRGQYPTGTFGLVGRARLVWVGWIAELRLGAIKVVHYEERRGLGSEIVCTGG